MNNWNNLNLFLNLEEQLKLKTIELTNQLLLACQKNDKPLVKTILGSGAYVNSYVNNQSPLMVCIENDCYDLAEYLLKMRASPNLWLKDNDPIWIALHRRKYNFLSLFLHRKIRLNVQKETGRTILIHAVENSDLTAVKIIAYKVNVNDRDNEGNTALHYNLSKIKPSQDDLEIGQILIACGAEANSRNFDGKTPKELATSEENLIVIEKLELTNAIDSIIPEPELTNEPEIKPEPPRRKFQKI